MKKKYFFMNKPEYIIADKNGKMPQDIVSYYYKNKKNIAPKDNPSSKDPLKYKNKKKLLYFFNFFIIFLMLAYWIHFNYNSSKFKKNMISNPSYEKSKFFVNDHIFFSFEKKILNEKISCHLYIYNLSENHLSLNKNYHFDISLINKKNNEVKLKKEEFFIKKKILPKKKIKIISIHLDKKKLLKNNFIILSINVNNEFTLYKNLFNH